MTIFRRVNESAVITVVSAAILAVLLFPIAIRAMPDQWGVLFVLIPGILVGFHFRTRFSRRARAAVAGLLLAVVLVYGSRTLFVMYRNVSDPPLWDFEVFWINGRVGAEGLNFYSTENFHMVAERDLGPNTIPASEIPAFLYPPPAMFIFTPLGWFDVHTALFLWNIVQLGCVLLSGWVLWSLFLKEDGIEGLLLVAALTILLFPTHLTLTMGQLNFMMFLMILLALRDRDRPRAGVWLALGIVIKPLVAGLLIYYLLRRQWRVLIVTATALGILSVLTILVFGFDNFMSFFLHGPTTSMTIQLYLESGYPSLYGTIAKLMPPGSRDSLSFTYPAFLIPAVIIAVSTIWLMFRMDRKESFVPYTLNLMMVMLLYPNTQLYYGMLLLVPILVLWKLVIGLSLWPKVAIIAITYGAFALGAWLTVFAVLLFYWLLCAYCARRANSQADVAPVRIAIPG